jgi:hypothetical protein
MIGAFLASVVLVPIGWSMERARRQEAERAARESLREAQERIDWVREIVGKELDQFSRTKE